MGASRFYLAPAIERLPDGDPKLHVVVLMCTYALEVAEGTAPAPYSDQDALRYARAASELTGDERP